VFLPLVPFFIYILAVDLCYTTAASGIRFTNSIPIIHDYCQHRHSFKTEDATYCEPLVHPSWPNSHNNALEGGIPGLTNYAGTLPGQACPPEVPPFSPQIFLFFIFIFKSIQFAPRRMWHVGHPSTHLQMRNPI
jgi:hypothetical protein